VSGNGNKTETDDADVEDENTEKDNYSSESLENYLPPNATNCGSSALYRLLSFSNF
jgi:hypothetical protein